MPEMVLRGRRLDQREYRRMVIEAFLSEEAVNNERLAQFADAVYRAGLRAGRDNAIADLRHAFDAGWAAGLRAQHEVESGGDAGGSIRRV